MKTKAVTPETEGITFEDIYAPEAFKEKYPHLFEGKGAPSLEYLMRTSKINGLEESGAVIEPVARRRQIVAPRFLTWLLSRRQAA